MTRLPSSPLTGFMLLAMCAAFPVQAGPTVGCVWTDADRQAERQVRALAELLCRHQLVPSPVLSRLPEDVSAAALLRREDLDFLERHPLPEPSPDVERPPGLRSALAHFTQCQVQVSPGTEWSAAFILETRPRWEETSWRTPEVLTPESPTGRMRALSRWAARHPDTVTVPHFLRFQSTREGWRAAYLLPEEAARGAEEEERRRLPPLEPRQCPVTREMAIRPFAPGMTPPRWRSGNLPSTLQDVMETGFGGFAAFRCVLTRQGEPRDCCLHRSLPLLDERLLRGLLRMRFTPVEEQGSPIDAEVLFSFRIFKRPVSPCVSYEPVRSPPIDLVLTPPPAPHGSP